MRSATEVLRAIGPGDRELLARFYDDVYLPAFAAQREPLEAWLAHLDGPQPYRQHIVVAGDGGRDGGVVFERYPGSGVGLVTYLVVAPHARRAGLGRRLFEYARAALAVDCALVLAEVVDPARRADPDGARRRARFERWGGRRLVHPYVQPALGAGLDRDRTLDLFAFFDGAAPPSVPGAPLAAFLREFFAVVEGVDVDADRELAPIVGAIGDQVALAAP